MKAAAYTSMNGVHGLAVDPTIPASTHTVHRGSIQQVMSVIPLTGQEMFDLALELINLSHNRLLAEKEEHKQHRPSPQARVEALLIEQHFETVHDGYICTTCAQTDPGGPGRIIGWTTTPLTHLANVHHFKI